MWKIPEIKIGDKIELIEDVYVKKESMVLNQGEQFVVYDVGERYQLPFIKPNGMNHELQLQPRTYKKC